jgi:Domain of unknown function (DUF4112)
MRKFVNPKALTPGQTRRLIALRRFAQLLDSAFLVPGTNYRVGLDPIFGLVPGLGDLVSPLFALGILWQARDLGIPRVVQLRMIINVAVDGLVGAVPLIGDLFDFVWKANDRNMALLERHAAHEHGAATADWLFVLVATLVIIAIAAIPFVIAAWAVGIIRQYL